MAEKMMGSLIYGDHPIPKRSRHWKERLKAPLIIAAVLIVIGGVAYKFFNYREEKQVTAFLDEIKGGHLDAAFANWDHRGSYTLQNFVEDWGENGYYTKGMMSAKVIDSNNKGSSVVVYLQIDQNRPVALLVDKETLKLSFAPNNKYK